MPCDLTVSLMEKPREVPRGSMAIEVSAFDPARQARAKAELERRKAQDESRRQLQRLESEKPAR